MNYTRKIYYIFMENTIIADFSPKKPSFYDKKYTKIESIHINTHYQTPGKMSYIHINVYN